MASLNKVFLIGNLTREPEVRYLPSGSAVADLRLAVNRKYKTQQGEDKEETTYVSVSVWGRQAETCSQYLSKGSPAMVEGRLRYEEWEKDGQKNNKLSVTAERVQFLGSPRSGGSYGDAPAAGGGSAGMPAPGPAGGGADDDDDLPF
jgi:single-strand DNA-binding protein